MIIKILSPHPRGFDRISRSSKAVLCLCAFAVVLFGTLHFSQKKIAQDPEAAASFFYLTTPAFAADGQKGWAGELEVYPGGGDDEAASEGEGNGIGGTGYKPGGSEGNGIGGTGQRANENGIGGTGIIGAITGFGSIFVNGFEVEIPDNMPVSIKDGRTTPDRLSIGQVVEIEADGDGANMKASSIRVRHELGGTIENIDHDKRTIKVLGQTIQLNAEADGSTPTDGLALGAINIGDRVDVSGFRRGDGTIEATRLDPLPGNEPDHLIGTLRKTGTSTLTVGGLALTPDQPVDGTGLEDGSEVRIVGHWQARRFHARRIHRRARWRFSNRVRRLAIEGYARRTGRGYYALGRYRLNHPDAAAFRQRMIFTGRLDARHLFIHSDVRASRLLKRRGRRIRAMHRNRHRSAPPRLRRKWQRRPHLRKHDRRHRLRRRRHRNR